MDYKACAAQRSFDYGRSDASYWFVGLEAGGTNDHTAYDSARDKVDLNLKPERLRLVLLADKCAPAAQRIIELLNQLAQISEVYAVLVRQYPRSGMTPLVPRVLKPSVLEAERRSATSVRGEPWSHCTDLGIQ